MKSHTTKRTSSCRLPCILTALITGLIAVACGSSFEPESSTNRDNGIARPEGSFQLEREDSRFTGRVFVRNYACALGGENSTCSERLSFGKGREVVYENSFSSEPQVWHYVSDESQIVVKSDDVADLIVFAFVVQDQTLVDRDGTVFVEQLTN